MPRLALAVAIACSLAACDTTAVVQPSVTAETSRDAYLVGDEVEVTVSNQTGEPVALFFFCGSSLQERTNEGWVYVWGPDCSRLRPAPVEIGPRSEYVGTLPLPGAGTLEVGATYRFRFAPVQRAETGAEPLAQGETVTNPFRVVADR